jgi:hypothetical protein
MLHRTKYTALSSSHQEGFASILNPQQVAELSMLFPLRALGAGTLSEFCFQFCDAFSE